jgi:hypothetical protein
LLSERGSKKEAEPAKEVEAQKALPTVDFAELARPIAEDLDLDDDGRKKWGATFQTMFETALGPIINAVVGLYRNQEEGWFEDLRGKRTELASDEVTTRVIAEARRLEASGRHKELNGKARWAKLIDDAIRLELRDLPSPSEVARTKQVETLRKKGRMAVPAKRVDAAPKPKGINDPAETERIRKAIAAAKEGVLSSDDFQRKFHAVVDM